MMNKVIHGDPLFKLLNPERLSAVVDVGANPIDGDPPYKKMLDTGLCTVLGFEPQESALTELLRVKSARETYLPYAAWDGMEHTLYVCRALGMTSLYKPDKQYLSLFNDFPYLGEVTRQETIKTKRFDEISEIEAVDYLKIDIQGSELSVFQSGRSRLSQTVVIHTEVSFMPLYEKQPLFWEVGSGIA